jgi:hypothetical protein
MKILIRYFIALVLPAYLSCSKLVDVGKPKTKIESFTLFSSQSAVTSAVAGYYEKLVSSSLLITNGGVTVFTGLSSDEIYNIYPNDQYDRLRANALLENNDITLDGYLWQAAYRNIYHANAILEGVENSKSLDKNFRLQVKGEMLLGRALNYFYMVNLFGSVPLVLTTGYEENQSMPGAPIDIIYAQIITDLESAVQSISSDYPSQGRVRPNKYAALGLLARIYLYRNNWQKAYDAATEIIAQKEKYILAGNIDDVFVANSSEAIWQIRPVEDGYMNTGEGLEFIPFDEYSMPSYGITEALLNSFEAGDERMKWMGAYEDGGTTVKYPAKYKIGFSSDVVENYFVMRLAEIYLIRAEASANMDNLSGCLQDLNIIRVRAGLKELELPALGDPLEKIMEERRHELFCEWGHRWLDLKRTGMADIILREYKAPQWESSDMLYPIPRRQRQLNPSLAQNPGY